ncbi:MAG: hypothetical protein HeimC3_43910 [Candidatus Heimdallarchaeota archaeon LC_3]|nr:MAG: hypothetical protein HeimC3_43910 [Candidatus Heimdallarchaeota archaeon LC_3]
MSILKNIAVGQEFLDTSVKRFRKIKNLTEKTNLL